MTALNRPLNRGRRVVGVALVVCLVCAPAAPAQAGQAAQPNPGLAAPAIDGDYFAGLYRQFYDTYRLGAGDEIAIRVLREPDFTVERTRVSPVGRIYHPLVGDVAVAGMTIDQLSTHLTALFVVFLKTPVVSVALLEAASARVAVIGDVSRPGILVMAGPMRLLDAITGAGGFTEFGSKTNLSLVRELPDGRFVRRQLNVKRLLEGQAAAEDNIILRGGDTVVVHGNAKQTLQYITSLAGFASFIAFLSRAGNSE